MLVKGLNTAAGLMVFLLMLAAPAQAQRWQETPGRYDPCVTRDPDDRSWANAM